METFTPIAMKCTQEQFNAIKPKLIGLKITGISPFSDYNYLVNNLWGELKLISNIPYNYNGSHNRKVYEEWNEEIFLKACGIETETLQEKEQRLLKELEKVRKEIEKNKIKVGDFIYHYKANAFYYIENKIILKNLLSSKIKKITAQELISKLNELIK